jgi:hypothetical protein
VSAYVAWFIANTSTGKQYGILVPYFDGKHFVGKVVRVDLFQMINNTAGCLQSWRIESKVNASSVRIRQQGELLCVCLIQ